MTTYELPPEPEIGSRVRAIGGEEFYRRDDGAWNSFDGMRTGGSWGWLVAYFAPLTLIEPDPWPTAPLIVADQEYDRPILLMRRPDGNYEDALQVFEMGDTLTNVVPVRVVPVAEWEALVMWWTAGHRGHILLEAVANLRNATDALGLDQ